MSPFFVLAFDEDFDGFIGEDRGERGPVACHEFDEREFAVVAELLHVADDAGLIGAGG